MSSLFNKSIYLESGHVHSPPQPTVRTNKTELCNFTKTSGKASGAVGVLTYDLFEQHQTSQPDKVAIMFSVPYDYGYYKNWMSVGIFPHGKEVNEALYKEMYYNDEKGFKRMEGTGSGLTFEGHRLDIKATMSPMGRAIMKVEVWEKLFQPRWINTTELVIPVFSEWSSLTHQRVVLEMYNPFVHVWYWFHLFMQ